MRLPIENYEPQITTLDRYADDNRRLGFRFIPSPEGKWYWIQHERFSVVRLPTFITDLPSGSDLNAVFWRHQVALVSFIIEPDETHPANSCLYTCEQYDHEKLDKKERASIRRALAMTRFDFIDMDTLIEHGFEAYHDTRGRAGFSDCSREGFLTTMTPLRETYGINVIGCWGEDGSLAGFLIFLLFDHFAEAVMHCSASRFFRTNLNNGLYHHLTDFSVNRMKRAILSIGLSSLQLGTKSGLHAFKVSAGFEANQVHRTFVLHPLLRPLVNRATYPAFRALQKHFPRSRSLRKLIGVLCVMLNMRENGESENQQHLTDQE
ncbi:MAG: hypothetical protein WCK27_02930 [Verrucomicrobiota bacterium]